MFAAMEVIWQELSRAILSAGETAAQAQLTSLHKLLALEIGIMLQTYKESYSEQVRQVERDALHERLSRAEHLAQVGQLAASLAHEIRNPLAGISGAIQVLRGGLKADDSRQPVLEEVLGRIKRLDGTVEDLLIYARPKPPVFRALAVSRWIERVGRLLEGEPRLAHVTLERSAPTTLPEIAADPDQLEQVLINLVINAGQASPAGGKVAISAEIDRDELVLRVRDHGAGMSAEVQQRALEPFFTTKTRGTGLGLAICQQIVTSH